MSITRRAEPPTEAHVRSLAAALPSGEAADTLTQIPGALKASEYAAALVVDGETICILGAVPRGKGALVWMHATPPTARRQHARWFIEEMRRQAAEVRKRFGVMHTAASPGHTEALRLLQALGFEISPPEPWGERMICRAEAPDVH